MGNTHSYKIADSLYLVRQTLAGSSQTPAKPVEVPTNHLFIYDCSGSMGYDLPKIREQLKKRLKSILGENDTFSAIWFSGRGQCDVLLEAEPVATLADLKNVEEAIDRWLRPIGLTGFKDPLEQATKLIDKIAKSNKNPFALCFMSDGCDNQGGRAEILKAAESVGAKVASATFVEYGYYADRPLLTSMAEKCGGTLIFAEDFNRYAPSFEAVLKKRPLGAKRVEVNIGADAVGGFAYALADGDLTTFGLTAGKISVPEGLAEVYFLSPCEVGSVVGDLNGAGSSRTTGTDFDATYAALSLFATRGRSDVVFPLLKAVGDAALIDQFANCFGKQKYSEFMETAKAATFDPLKRFKNGYDPNKVPREDAYTVLDALNALQSNDENRVVFEHPAFKYTRIGRGRVDASDQLSPDEQAEVEKLTDEMRGLKDTKKLKAIVERIASITSKAAPLKFVEDEGSKKRGYSIDKLTFNEERPNVSIQVRKTGSVDIAGRIPSGFTGKELGKVPETFATFIFRNYAIVKDGLVNVEVLPVRLSDATKKAFADEITSGRLAPEFLVDDNDGITLLNLKVIPVVNRKMVKTVSAKAYFETQFALTKAQAAQKVYNAYAKEKLPSAKSETFAALYGEAAATWLKENGFSDNGFAPTSTTQTESTDVYMGKKLKASIKGYSSLPSLKDFREKQAAKGKYNGPGELMKPYVEEVEAFLASDFYTKASDKDGVLKAWLNDRQKQATTECRKHLFAIAQQTFAIVVGQVWFSEFSSLDETELTVSAGTLQLACKVEQQEFEISI